MKTVLKGAGTGNTPMAFLFSDTQIINESFVEDINNMLNSGEVPNIFPNDERVAICEVRAGSAKKLLYHVLVVSFVPVVQKRWSATFCAWLKGIV